jgi:NADPH2:quinone reductase
MLAMRAESFTGHGVLKQAEIPKPEPVAGRVLVRITAAGVTPLEHTILSGAYSRAKVPLVLGNEGAGVIEDAGGSGWPVGARVMFTGLYGVREDGSWREWALVRPEDLRQIPDGIGDAMAASLPVAYLTAQLTLSQAGFEAGKTVLAPAIGGSVGNATYQLARAQGAGKVLTTTTSAAKAARALNLGYENVIDLSSESLGSGVERILGGKGVDIVIDSIGGEFTGHAVAAFAPGGVLVILGYSAGRRAVIDVTDLIWKGARIESFILFAQPSAAIADAWNAILPPIVSGLVKPVVEKTYPFEGAVEALRHLVEDRPFGKVVLVR